MNNIQRAILNNRNLNNILIPDNTYKKKVEKTDISPMIKEIKKKEKVKRKIVVSSVIASLGVLAFLTY